MFGRYPVGPVPGGHNRDAGGCRPLAQGAHAPAELLELASRQLGTGALSDRTRSYVLEQLRDLSFEKKPELVAERAVGLLLGAPELQRR